MKFRNLSAKADSDELLQLHNNWIDAELRGDFEQVLRLCTDDIQFLPPDARLVVGKQAVREFLVTSSSPLISVDTFDVRFEASETLAFKTCRFTTHVAPTDGSEVGPTVTGIHAWLLRRVEGAWLVSYVTWHCAGEEAF